MLRKRRIQSFRSTLCVEVLEDRMLLDGKVTAGLDATGLLTLTGDTRQNAIAFTQGPFPFLTVFGLNGTTVNGQFAQTFFNSVTSISILFQNGSNTVIFDTLNNPGIPGAITITEGTGNNTVILDNATFQRADITLGKEINGAVGSNFVELSNDLITGQGNAGNLNVNILNESGVSGSAGGGPGAVNTLLMNGLQFTAGGHLNARVDDGVTYFDSGQNVLTAASMVQIANVNTFGNVGVVLGDHFESVQTAQSNAGNLNLSVGSDVDTVDLTGNIIKNSENVTVGNDSPYPTTLLPLPFVRVRESAIGSGGANDGLRLTVGSNTNTTVPTWLIEEKNTTVNGSQTFVAANGDSIFVDPVSISGSLAITMGSGGVNGIESLTMLGVMSSDPLIAFRSNAGDTVFINMNNVVITDRAATFRLQDSGFGADLVTFSDLHVAGLLFVFLSSSGHNVVNAHNVTAAAGFIFGGTGFGDVYHNQGGNQGFFVFGFP